MENDGNIEAETLSVITDIGGYPGDETGGWWKGSITLSPGSWGRLVYTPSLLEEITEDEVRIINLVICKNNN